MDVAAIFFYLKTSKGFGAFFCTKNENVLYQMKEVCMKKWMLSDCRLGFWWGV